MTFPPDPNAPGGEDRSDALRKAAAAHNQRNAQARVARRSFEQLAEQGEQPKAEYHTIDRTMIVPSHTGKGTTMVLAPDDGLELERAAKGF